MPLAIPKIDDRKYQDLLDEALARIPVHNPDWTNFNKSDPGVTLIEIFAFLTESLLYRANQIPERNRRKFLSLLGVPLQPAWYSRGIVTFSNERGPLQTITLSRGLEAGAGSVPFRTEQGLDVLPVEARAYYKRIVTEPSEQVKAHYRQLYASYRGQPVAADIRIYQTVPFPGKGGEAVDIGRDTVDRSLWIALMARPGDDLEATRKAVGGKTLSLGVIPALADGSRQLLPGGQADRESTTVLEYKMPIGGTLPVSEQERIPQYRALDTRSEIDVLTTPGVVQITLPAAAELTLWDNLDPLEPGVGDFPPALEDTKLNDRVITWVRLRASAAVQAALLWTGINAASVSQRAHVSNEVFPPATGAPDQVVSLSKTPVIPGSVRLTVTDVSGRSEPWKEIDDLTSAGSEVQVEDLRLPPGSQPAVKPLKEIDEPASAGSEVQVEDSRPPPGSRPVINPLGKVFTVDSESGEIRFGDGMRGVRPPFGARIRADYDYGVGREGNVGAGAINSSPALPAGIKVTNPVRTWGGAEAETVAEGEKQIARFLQHRDRLVNAADFETIVKRTPGVDIGRVEVIAAFNPELTPNEPGDAPGAVTVLVIPKYDTDQPDAPVPDRLFLNTICEYVNPRRLVTTEVFLRGPAYKGIWISAGVDVVAGMSVAEVREAVRRALIVFLSPLPPLDAPPIDDLSVFLTAPQYAAATKGWPLRKPVASRELLAVASRVKGVLLVNDVLLAEGDKPAQTQITMSGLELPRVIGISVAVGAPADLDQLRGRAAAPDVPGGFTAAVPMVPVPLIPEECK